MIQLHIHSAVHSVIRSRSVIHHLGHVSDTIAANLRAFSMCARRCDDETSRKSRSSNAFREVASIAPRTSRGVDARSLAAKAPPTFTITRLNASRSRTQRHVVAPRKDLEGGYRGGLGQREGGVGLERGSAGLRGTGGRVGVGGGGDGGVKRAATRNKLPRTKQGKTRDSRRGDKRRMTPRQPKKKPWEEEIEDPYSEEEEAYMDESSGGLSHPYIPETSNENLARFRPALLTHPSGVADTVRYRFAIATDNVSPQYRYSDEHIMRYQRGNGTLFEDMQQRFVAQNFMNEEGQLRAAERGSTYVPNDMGMLPLPDKEAIIDEWVAGHYAPLPCAAADAPVTANVANYLARNETWLPEDARKFQAKLVALLPDHLRPKTLPETPRKLRMPW